ncbi:universal stress protein [Albibacterium profundi]|uniref:Universal stress protein n=1 Tax=Albibacterium profundi TaxID=3134906 RepID=A0ABV5CFZ3_9SPHI
MKNILVALDLMEMDESIIRYAYSLNEQTDLSQIHFIHNIKIYEVDEVIQKLLGDKDIKAIIEKNLRAKISKVFPDENVYDLTILEGSSTEYSLNTWAEKHNIDTIVLGFKQEEYGTASMSQKLIRIYKGNLLLVPANASLNWGRILVPTDFSAPFQLVAKKLADILKRIPSAQVKIVKAFTIPSLFFPFIDDKKAIEQTQKHIKKQYAEAVKKYKLSANYEFNAYYEDGQGVVGIIEKESRRFDADVIVMSAKGSGNIASLFIGSTINEIVTTNPFNTIYILK